METRPSSKPTAGDGKTISIPPPRLVAGDGKPMTIAPPRLVLAFLGHVVTHGITLPPGAEITNLVPGLSGPFEAQSWGKASSIDRKAVVASMLDRPESVRARHKVGLWRQVPGGPAPAPTLGGIAYPARSGPSSNGFRPVNRPPVKPRNTSRVRLPEPANHPARRELREVSEEEPGLNIHEIAQRLKLSRSATRYHLRCLIREGKILTHRQGHHVLHFPGTMRPTQRQAVAFLRIGSIRSIIEATIQNPKLEPAALAEKLGITARSVRRSLRMLQKAGLAREPDASSNARGRHIELHPDVRIAWVMWCKNPDRAETIAPLAQTPAWLAAVEVVMAHLVGNWFG